MYSVGIRKHASLWMALVFIGVLSTSHQVRAGHGSQSPETSARPIATEASTNCEKEKQKLLEIIGVLSKAFTASQKLIEALQKQNAIQAESLAEVRRMLAK